MSLFIRALSFGLVLVAVLAGPLLAQSPMQATEILALHGVGVPAADIIAILEKNGSGITEAAAVKALEAQGVPAEVVRWLSAKLPTPKVALTAAEVLRMHKAGLSEQEILEVLRASSARFDLTLDDTLGLIREGLSPAVIKAMRERGATSAVVAAAAKPVSLEDLITMADGGISGEEMLRRIRAADTRFEVSVDDLLRLSRRKVPEAVVKEVWSRKIATPAAATGAATNTQPTGSSPEAAATASNAAPAPDAAATLSDLILHREAEGGCSLNVPRGWFLHRERAGANHLVSFSEREEPATNGLADAELQVFSSRATNPERLTETNLEPIATNFLNRLQASFAGRKISFSSGAPTPTRLSGRSALLYRVASATADGTSHEGEVLVMLRDERVWVVSWAVRAERLKELGEKLASCAQSFAVASDPAVEKPAGNDDAQISTVFGIWRTAVLNSDWSMALKVLPEGSDEPAARARFATLSRQQSQPGSVLALAGVRREGDKASADVSLGSAGNMTVALARSGAGWRVQP
jgi:hypothetical protein